MTVQELIDQLMAVADKTLEVWTADNDCYPSWAQHVRVEPGNYGYCDTPHVFISDCLPPVERSPREKQYAQDTEKYRLERILYKVRDTFTYLPMTQRTLCNIEQFVRSRAVECELWDATKFIIRIVSDSPNGLRVNIRPVPMTEVAYRDLHGEWPKDGVLNGINND